MGVPKIEWSKCKADPSVIRATIGDVDMLVQHCDKSFTKDGTEYWFWRVISADHVTHAGDVRKKSHAICQCEWLGVRLWKAAQYDAAQKHEGSK